MNADRMAAASRMRRTMGEVVNLRRVKKAKTRRDAGTQAAANREKHGTPKALRDASRAEKNRLLHVTDAHKLETE
ncbi:MAG: DUF4169 family protein [Terracidiphilus sp.]